MSEEKFNKKLKDKYTNCYWHRYVCKLFQF